MKKKKIALMCAMALCMTSVVYAEGEIQREESSHLSFTGTIEGFDSENGSILISGGEETMDAYFKEMIFNFTPDTLIIDGQKMKVGGTELISKGISVSVHYRSDAPMTKSLPPITTASVIVVNPDSSQYAVKVSEFDGNLLSSDNNLKLSITEDTVLLDRKGASMPPSEFIPGEYVAFYGPYMTMSIPAQSGAVSLISMNEKVSNTGPDVEVSFEDVKNESVNMVPVRETAEALGFKVEWNNESKTATMVNGNTYLTLTAGSDKASFAKMIVKLEKAPEIRNGILFTPESFFTDFWMN